MDPQDLQELKKAIQDSIAAGFKNARPSGGGGNTNTPSAPDGIGGLARMGNVLKDTGSGLASSVGSFITILERGNGNLADFGKAVNSLGSELDKSFTKNIPIIGDFLGDTFKVLGMGVEVVSGMLQDQANMYRYLSKVGGGFGGDLSQLRLQAGEARLSLRDYAEIVANNSQTLSMFEGGVDGGAAAVAKLGRTMFDSGVIDRLQNLGMSIAEANEFVVQNIALTRRQDILSQRSEEEQLLAAAELAQSMTVMSKLTGKQAKAIQDDLERRQRDGAQIGALRMLEANGIENAQEAYNQMQTGLAGAPTVLKDLMDDIIRLGVPVGEATKNFAATNHEAYALAQQAAAALKAGDVEQAERLSQEATAAALKFAKSRQGAYLASMAGVSEVGQTQADALAEMDPLITAIESKIGATGDIIEGFNTVVAEMTEKVRNTMYDQTENMGSYMAVREFEQQFAELSGEFQKVLGGAQSSAAINDKLVELSQDIQRFDSPALVKGLQDKINGLLEKNNVLQEKGPAAVGMADLETFIGRGLKIDLQAVEGDPESDSGMKIEEIHNLLKQFNETQNEGEKQKLLKDLISKNILDKEGNLSQQLQEGLHKLQQDDYAAVEGERAAGKRIDATTIIDDALKSVTEKWDSITQYISDSLDTWGNKFQTFINEEMGLSTLMDKLSGFKNDFQSWYDDQFATLTKFYDDIKAKKNAFDTWWDELDLNPFSQNIKPNDPQLVPAMYQPTQNFQPNASMSNDMAQQSQNFQPNASMSNDMTQQLFQELLTMGPMSQDKQMFAAENAALLSQLKEMVKSGVTDIKKYNGDPASGDLNKLTETWSSSVNEILVKIEKLMENYPAKNNVDMSQVVQKLTDLNNNVREVVELNTKSNNMSKKNLDYNRESSMYA